jgi:DNA-binding NtrC family response regulator
MFSFSVNNRTTTHARELADTANCSGHRRGSFTGGVSDSTGAASDARRGRHAAPRRESATLPLDIQPKLLRFLEQGEIMPVGEKQPARRPVDRARAGRHERRSVEQRRVPKESFREDLYYRLSVIRDQVPPPLRDRREEVPSPEHVSFLRSTRASGRAKPDVHLSSADARPVARG